MGWDGTSVEWALSNFNPFTGDGRADPFAQDFPDTVESTLDSLAIMSKFNPCGIFAGQYLAIGRLDGYVTVVDFETKRTIKLLMGHVKPVSALDWSRNSRFLLTASRDWNVIVWDLSLGERAHTIRFDAPVTSAQFHPINRLPPPLQTWVI
jgi:COMPASS component SWD1